MEIGSAAGSVYRVALGAALLLFAQVSLLPNPGELELRLRKNYGYQAGSTIQGSFTLTASGTQDLKRVVFYIDGEVMGVDEQTPFQWQFSTSDFALGAHEIFARGETGRGEPLHSEVRQLTFISPEAVMGEVMKIIIPISGALVLLTVAGMALTMYAGRQPKSQKAGEYGRAGGAVCSRCDFPFSRHLFSPNLVTGKLEKCPHCGKWSVAGRASPAELSAAEDRMRMENQQGMLELESGEERMRRLIVQSRYED